MKHDLLEDLFDNQEKLMDIIREDKIDFWRQNPYPFNDFSAYRKFMLSCAIIHEVIEYQQDLKWKWWKAQENYKVDDENRRHVELPDIFHFFIQLCIEEDVNPLTLYTDYMKKLNENKQRQEKRY